MLLNTSPSEAFAYATEKLSKTPGPNIFSCLGNYSNSENVTTYVSHPPKCVNKFWQP